MIGWEPPKPLPVFFRLRMQAVTVGHLELLYENGVDVNDGLTFADAMLCAFVCSSSHKASRKHLRRWWCPMFFKFWGWLCGAKAFHELDDFQEWFVSQLKGPLPAPRKHDATVTYLAAPTHYNLKACLMGMLGHTKEQAENETVIEASRLVCSLGEARGEMKLWSRKDEQLREMSVRYGLVEPRRN